MAVGLRGTRFIQLMQVDGGEHCSSQALGLRSVCEQQLAHPLHCAASVYGLALREGDCCETGEGDKQWLAVGFEGDAAGVVALFRVEHSVELKNPVCASLFSLSLF